VFHWHVPKSNVQTESPLLHSQLLYIKAFPLSVLKLTALASISVDVTGSMMEQLSKYHSVAGDEASAKLIFCSTHHPWHVVSCEIVDGSAINATSSFLLANV